VTEQNIIKSAHVSKKRLDTEEGETKSRRGEVKSQSKGEGYT